AEVAAFCDWLRDFNREAGADVGFYGLDVYSLWESMRVVIDYMSAYRPDAMEAVRAAARCFEPYSEDPQEYARATRLVPTSCEDQVVALLREVRSRMAQHDGDVREGSFEAEQNALVLKNAEAYYRAMVRGGPDSWNIRDRHMTETLDRLLRHHGPASRAIVWEHNTHIGDARFTDMAGEGMVNVGQLVREAHG